MMLSDEEADNMAEPIPTGTPAIPASSTEGQVQSRVTNALDADIPKLYANTFAIVMGTADVTIVLEQNGRPIALLNLSFTSSKTLASKLGGVISKLEENSGREIMTTDDIQKMFGV
jgi:hypothetical protein